MADFNDVIQNVQELLKKGENDKALSLLEDQLSEQHKSPQVYELLANLYLQLDRREKLEHLAFQAFENKVYIPDLLNIYGELNWQNNNPNNALKAWKLCLGIDPDNPVANYYMGLSMRDMGSYSASEQYLQKALKLTPKDPNVRLTLASVLLKRHRYQMVLSVLKPLEKTEASTIIDYAFLIAKASIAMFDYEKALKYVNRILKVKPDLIDFVLLKIDIYLKRNKLDYARRLISKASGLFPGAPQITLLLLRYHFRKGAYKKASVQVEKLLKDNPENPLGLLWKGKILIARKMPEKALIILSQATQQQEMDSEIMLNIAEAWDMYGNIDQSIRIMNEALKLDPENFNIMDRLGEYLLRRQSQKDLQKARLYFEAVLNANYMHPGANYHLAWYYSREQKYKKALNHILMARKQNPESFDSFMLHSVILDRMKKLDEVEKLLHQGLEKFPENAEKIQTWLLNHYLNAKNLPEAISMYSEMRSTPDIRTQEPEILLFKKRKPSLSIFSLEDKINGMPATPKIYLELGYLYTLQRDYQNAFRIWRLMTQHFDFNPEAVFNMASTQLNNGKILKAQQLIQDLHDEGISTPAVYFLEGKVLKAKGAYLKAVRAFNNCLESKRFRCEALAEIGAVQFRKKKYPDAIVAFESSAKTMKNKFQYYHLLAASYRMTNKASKAIRGFEKAIKVEPGRLENYTQLIDLYESRGQYRHAEIVERLYLRAQNEANISRIIDEGKIGEVTTLVILVFNDGRQAGEVGKIEASVLPGRGGLVLTGNMTTYFKEAAKVAHDYLKSQSQFFGLDDFFKKNSLHVHIPHTGGIPTDGPSAGLALVSSIYSAILRRKISSQIAMTGELSLHGEILSIGGLEYKLVAAIDNGVKKVFIPKNNFYDFEQLPDSIKNELEITLVGHVEEVFTNLFGPTPRKPR